MNGYQPTDERMETLGNEMFFGPVPTRPLAAFEDTSSATSPGLSTQYVVRRVPGGIGKTYIREHHYSRSCHNGPMTWGMFEAESDNLVGICAFATPSSENVRRAPFGPGFENSVTELHRLHIQDTTPTNAESWFVSRALKGLKEERPLIRAVLSFADSTEGHFGAIYQALNALYCGTTGRARFWRDQEGRLRHPRQSGHNVTPDEAAEKGWVGEMREAKYRYLFLVGNRAEKRDARRRLRLDPQPYPKAHPAPEAPRV